MTAAKVLIVDDNRDLADGLKAGIEEEGCRVQVAYSGEAGIKLFQQADFDITFMDVKLPGIDGINGLMNILACKPDAKVVVMSGYKIDSLLAEARNRGAFSVLQKPFSVEQALALISAA